MPRRLAVTALFVLLHAAPQASASAAGPVPLGLTEPVVAAAGDGQVVVAGLRRSKVEMMRVDGGGRVLERRTVGGGRSADVRVAVAGRRIAVSWIEDQRTLVLARRALGGARFTFDGTSNSSIRFHRLAMNARGVVVDAFKDEDNAATETRTGIAGLVARPGQIARRVMIAPRDARNTNLPEVGVDAAGGFHVSWISDVFPQQPVLGVAGADAEGRFGAPAEQGFGSSLSRLQVRTAGDGGQLAAFQRHSGRGHVLLSTSRRPPGGPWEPPVVRFDLGEQGPGHDLAVGPTGDAFLTFGPDPDQDSPGLLRAVLVPADGPATVVPLGRGTGVGGLVDEQGRARAVWGNPRGAGSTQTVLVDVRSGRVGRVRTALRGCRPDPFDDPVPLRPVGRPDGPLAFSLACGKRGRTALLQPDVR